MTIREADSAGGARRRIELASHPALRIGVLDVRPGLREVIGPAGRELIEPRVMMLLVALAEANGETVSRDELIERCWQGRIVGDDAINRVVARVRRLADGLGARSFSVQTVARVGYRLVEPPSAADTDRVSTPQSRRWQLGAFVAGLVALIAALYPLRPVPEELRATVGSDVRPDNPDTTALELIERGRGALRDSTFEQAAQGVAFLRQATALEPGSAEAWGTLALAYATYLRRSPPDEQVALARRARSAAARALAIDPRQSDALTALSEAEPSFANWAKKDALQRRLLAAAPDTPELLYQRSRFLHEIGLVRDGLPLIERAAAREPFDTRMQATLARHLVAAGRIEEAERAVERLGATWPRHYASWFARFYTNLYGDRLGAAQAMLADRANWPVNVPADEIERVAKIARAVGSGAEADRDAVIAEYDALLPRGKGYAENAMHAAAALGRADAAFRYARALYLDEGVAMPPQRFLGQSNYGLRNERDTHSMFLPPFRDLQADPRYLQLMADIGLVAYWRHSRSVPDFCRVAALRSVCASRGIAVR